MIFLLLFMGLVLPSSGCGDGQGKGQEGVGTLASAQSIGSGIVPRLGFNEGLGKAKRDKKPILLEFYTDWCVYCKKFQRETIANRKVAKMLAERFVYVRLNAENSKDQLRFMGQSLSSLELARSFGIRGYPSLAFLDTEGKPITMIHGFVPADRFFPVLDYIAQKCYLARVSFDDFIRRGNCN
jgi:thioredoxin-related protein